MTIQILFNRTWRMHWNQERFHKSGWAKEVQGLYDRHLHDAFGHVDALKVKPSDVRVFRQSLAKNPVTANRCLEVLGRIYSFAEEFEILPQGSNPVKLVKSFSERKRKRYATKGEIHEIAKILKRQKTKYPLEVAFIQLLMLTGIRPRGLARARLDQLQITDGGMGLLCFDGKTFESTGIAEAVAIPHEAMREIVSQLPVRADDLLIGDVKYRNFWKRVRAEAKCEDLWVRDWRRTFATVGLSAGINLSIIGELLNHRTTQTTLNYAKLLPAARFAATTAIAAKIQSC